MKMLNTEADAKMFYSKNQEQITSIIKETQKKLLSLSFTDTELSSALLPGKVRNAIFHILIDSPHTSEDELLNDIREQLYDKLLALTEPNAKEASIVLNIGTATLHTIFKPKNEVEDTFNEHFEEIVDVVNYLTPQINALPSSEEADLAILCHLQSNVLDSIKDSNLSAPDAVRENLLSSIRAEIRLQKN